ncbi:ABC transporter permease [Enterococcus saccharolyticus]|uniref:ABC transporter permease n=1 Tax=Enterococcus saccharolyticus TaxID=41997 RepID=UPI0009002F47|nr:ABC transporter permease [Enterococcus saccharolyticus]
MLFKIIWRSFLRQTRNYIVYFLSMTTAVMIFYSFSAMTYDQPLTLRARQDIQIEGVLTLGNVFVAMVVLIFMLGANQFFIQQRQKEIGLYQLFGLRKSRIIFQFLIEGVVLNVFSLIVGIVMGIIFSKFFAMILIKAMDLNLESRFFISWASILTTVVMFFVAISLISLQNMWLIWQKQLIDLFQPKRVVSSRRFTVRWSAYVIGLFSVLLISIGYYIAVNFVEVLNRYIQQTEDFSSVLWVPLLIFSLCVCGTYLFFAYGIQACLYLTAKWRMFSYRDVRFFALQNTRHLLSKSWRTLALISVIVGIAISLIGGAISVFEMSYRYTDLSQPVDFQITADESKQLEQLIQESGGEITDKLTVSLKAVGTHSLQPIQFLEDETYENIAIFDLISESMYHDIRQIVPRLPELKLTKADQGVMVDLSPAMVSKRQFSKAEQKITLPNENTVHLTQRFSTMIGDSLLRYGSNLLVVTDELYQKVEGIDYQLVYLNATGYNEEQLQKKYVSQLPTDWGHDVSYHYVYKEGQLKGSIKPVSDEASSENKEEQRISRLNQTSRYPNVRSDRRQGGIFLYVALFVGMIVLITTASTLMVRQFFEAGREKQNYQLLQQIGIPKKTLRRAVYHQNAWIFFPTMLLATTHGSFAIYMLTELVQDANYWVAYLFCFITIFIFTSAYFLTTNFYLRIVEE